MKINEFIIENFQTVSINGILRSLNNDEKKIYTKVKENGKLLKSEFNLTSYWNVDVVEQGNELIITPASWQAKLAPNSTASFGMIANGVPNTLFKYTLVLLDASGNVIATSNRE